MGSDMFFVNICCRLYLNTMNSKHIEMDKGML